MSRRQLRCQVPGVINFIDLNSYLVLYTCTLYVIDKSCVARGRCLANGETQNTGLVDKRAATATDGGLGRRKSGGGRGSGFGSLV